MPAQHGCLGICAHDPGLGCEGGIAIPKYVDEPGECWCES